MLVSVRHEFVVLGETVFPDCNRLACCLLICDRTRLGSFVPQSVPEVLLDALASRQSSFLLHPALEVQHHVPHSLDTCIQTCMQAITYVPPEEDELVEMYKRWAIAYSACLMCHLRETEDMEAVLKVQLFFLLLSGLSFLSS